MKSVLLSIALIASVASADQPLNFSPNGYWPTGIFNTHCPHQYTMTVEPGHFWIGCWGRRD